MTVANDEKLKQALSYAKERNWLVFPVHDCGQNGQCSCGKKDCSSPAKHPRTQNGFKEATTDEVAIRQWWEKWLNANIGVATDDVSSIDVLAIETSLSRTDILDLQLLTI